MTLQARLALLYLLIGAPTLLISSVTVYLISKERIYEGVDESLMARVQSIEASLVQRAAPLTPAEVESSRRALDRQVADGAVFQIRSADGTVLFSSADGDVPLPNSGGGTPKAGFSSRALVAERTRILIAPVVQLGETIGYVEARTPLTLADASVADVRGTLVAGNLVILFLTALPAYVVAGKAIGPVRTVSRLAREIVRTGDFARRLPESASAVETKELIAAFNEMVERVDRMIGAQKAFLADSSHELRRPLTILRTNLDVLSDPNLKPADRKAVEREMRVEVEAMSRLLSELLLLSREEEQAFSFDELDLSSLCEASLSTARATHHRHSFLAEIEAGVRIRGDAERISQLLDNLLENAASYTPNEGIIALRLRQDAGEAVLEVSDTGLGMTEEDLRRAFQRFYRGSGARTSKAEGFGLGLAIAKHVVDAHEGTIDLSSQLGSGTTVTVRFRALAEREPSADS